MKDRITLLTLLILLWVFLFIFQKYTPVESSIYIVLSFMSLYTSLLYIAFYYQRRKTQKAIKKGIITEEIIYTPFISVMIPAHNEENVIEETILNILKIDYEKFEIIVIDDRSTDNTANILKNICETYPQVKYFTRDENAFPGKSAVLNEALKISNGEVVCVFDADAKVKPNFFKSILPLLSRPDIGAVQARKCILNKDSNFLTRYQHNEYTLDSHFQVGRDAIRGAVELRGNGQLIKREALDDVNGWNNYTITDDLDLSTRLHINGWDIRFSLFTEVYEEGILNFIPLLRQRRRWVEGSIRRYLDNLPEILFSKDTSLRVNLDMWAYISQFVLPVWLISEWGIQGIRLIKGVDNNILSSVAIIPAICLFFMSGLIYSIRKYNGVSRWQSFKQSLETGICMLVVWTPVVSYIIFKIIFMKRSMDWDKTEHGLQHSHSVEAEVLN